MADLLHNFEALNIPIDESTMDEFVHADDENGEEFSKEIMEDVNEVLTRAQTTVGNKDANEDMMVEACAQNSEPVVLTNDVTFDGFEKMYNIKSWK